MFIAHVEPQIDFNYFPIKNVFEMIREYSLDEFYSNQWVDVIKNKRNRLVEIIYNNNYIHPLIRNYLELIKKRLFHLQLVHKYKDGDKEYYILHTYKLNIFKRIWRKYHSGLSSSSSDS
jgi:hypothetical protein